MSSPEKKRRRKNPTAQSTSILSLPDDLLLTCISRLSRLYYLTLSLVSKHFRSLIASPELYKVRSLLGRTESCLYVCIEFSRKPHYRWFTLYRKPYKTLTNENETKKSSKYVLAPVPIPDSPHGQFSGLVAAGPNIYCIGQSIDEEPSSIGYSSVSILDCLSHTWSKAPSLPLKLYQLTASIVDRSLYVAGIYLDKHGKHARLKNSFQVLDRETQVWIPKPIPKQKFCNSSSACIDGKFHVKSQCKVIAYNSKEGRWDIDAKGTNYKMGLKSNCEIDNVLYSACYGQLTWYDTKVGEWKELKGLGGIPKVFYPPTGSFYDRVRLADHGGKIAVFWEKQSIVCGKSTNMISYVEISLERRKFDEIWGTVEWSGLVLMVPECCRVVKALAVTV